MTLKLILEIRRTLSIEISRRLIPTEFSIISDDCWGGQLYRQLNIRYLTPTVGLFVMPDDYIDYIESFDAIHKEDLIFIESDKDYPVATLSGIEIHFMHYNNEEEARSKYWNRFKRMHGNKQFIKIDFGKPGYTKAHIQKWNSLRIANSLAFYPATIELPKEGVFNGVLIPDWQLDGAHMFDISRKHFDVFKWVRKGVIHNGLLYRLLNVLLFDQTTPRRIANKVFHYTR